MESKLLKVQDDYEWVVKIIRSAQTDFQCDACENLIKNFIVTHPDYGKLSDILNDILIFQRETVSEVENIFFEEDSKKYKYAVVSGSENRALSNTSNSIGEESNKSEKK